MTFYWWSHWFWITSPLTKLIFVLILACMVQTYPSQESISSQKFVTKLYQQINTTLSWETSTASNNLREELPTEITKQETITDKTQILKRKEYGTSNGNTDNEKKPDVLFSAHIEAQYEDATTEQDVISQIEMKRAATDEYQNNSLPSNQNDDQSNLTIQNVVPMLNYTKNFSNQDTTTIISNIETVNASNTKNYIDAMDVKFTNMTQLSLDGEESNDTAQVDESAGKSSVEANDSTGSANSISVAIQRVPFTLENANKVEDLRLAENEHRARKSKVLAADYQHASRVLNYPLDSKNLLTRSASIAPNELDGPRRKLGGEANISTEALTKKRSYFLNAGTISAICLTIFGIFCTIGTAGIVLYRRRYLNKPQTLSEPDSSVYIDDSTMRDNSDEMYSLDNDSFLNSLEAMTIQNYWTDTVKHTKL